MPKTLKDTSMEFDGEMEFINRESIKEFSNPGVVSRQLINPDNSKSERVTITEVHLEVGASQPRHKHDTSEQIWYAVKGKGKYDSQIKLLTRKERTHRLCTRGAILEKFLGCPDELTDEQVEEILKIAFQPEAVSRAIEQFRESNETGFD